MSAERCSDEPQGHTRPRSVGGSGLVPALCHRIFLISASPVLLQLEIFVSSELCGGETG